MQRCALIILSVAMIVVTSANHDLYLGEREEDDYLLEQKQIDRNPGKSEFSKILEFTDPISLDPDTRISRVEVIDYQQNETSAKPRVILGGPGHSSVTINFISLPITMIFKVVLIIISMMMSIECANNRA